MGIKMILVTIWICRTLPTIYMGISPNGIRNPEWPDALDRIGWIPRSATRGGEWWPVDQSRGIPPNITGVEYDLKTVWVEQYDQWEYIEYLIGCLRQSKIEYQTLFQSEGEEVHLVRGSIWFFRNPFITPSNIETIHGTATGPSGESYYYSDTPNGRVYLHRQEE